jgi:hypothetical protein
MILPLPRRYECNTIAQTNAKTDIKPIFKILFIKKVRRSFPEIKYSATGNMMELIMTVVIYSYPQRHFIKIAAKNNG